jgi:hypothetical protein
MPDPCPSRTPLSRPGYWPGITGCDVLGHRSVADCAPAPRSLAYRNDLTKTRLSRVPVHDFSRRGGGIPQFCDGREIAAPHTNTNHEQMPGKSTDGARWGPGGDGVVHGRGDSEAVVRGEGCGTVRRFCDRRAGGRIIPAMTEIARPAVTAAVPVRFPP